MSTRLSAAGWSIVIGDTALDPSRTQKLLQRIGALTKTLTKDKAEEWAEANSKTLKPADFLSGKRGKGLALYVKIERDLPGYEGLVLGMPEGNYKKAAMEHLHWGHLCFAAADLASVEEAYDRLSVGYRQLKAAQDKVYEERIERDRAARYGSSSYRN